MKKSIRRLLKTMLVLSLVFTFVISLTTFAPVRVNAANSSIKAVYSLSQLKKAMKAKSAATIIFRTEVFDSITIPSVKNAKNKDVIIIAQNAAVKNKSEFKSIKVVQVNAYTEAVSGNNIYWMDNSNHNLVIAKSKTVNSITFSYSPTYDPRYILRKGAKIKNLNIEVMFGNGTSVKKGKTIKVDAQESSDPLSNHFVTSYKYNKRGQIIEVINESAYGGTEGCKFKYDKNGNYKEITYTESGDIVISNTNEYDADNKQLKSYSTDNSGGYDTYIEYTYDADGNMTRYAVNYADGNLMYDIVLKHDKNGRCIETYNSRYDIRVQNTYDSKGSIVSKTEDNKGEVTETEYAYDKNGMLRSTVKKEGTVFNEQIYAYDHLGNRVYLVSQYLDENREVINENRYAYMINDYVGDYPVYEDGFMSPVNHNYNSDFLKESGFSVVTGTEELINAIRPGAGVIIAPGEYNLSDYIEKQDIDKFNSTHQYVRLDKEYDGYELVIKDVDDLLISGGLSDPDDTTLLIDPRYSAVLTFEDCDRLQLCSFTAGHTMTGDCSGNVIDFYNCKDVGIYNADIFGCGVYGLGIFSGSGDVRVYNSCIHHCSSGIDELDALGGDVTFTNCVLDNSDGGGSWYYFENEDNITLTFKNCSFGPGESNSLFYKDYINFVDCLWCSITSYPEW